MPRHKLETSTVGVPVRVHMNVFVGLTHRRALDSREQQRSRLAGHGGGSLAGFAIFTGKAPLLL